jgi:hypothetical protein
MTSWSLLALLFCGAALGPHALNIVSPRLLSFLQPVTPMAVATVGASLGLAADMTGGARARGLRSPANGLLISIVIVAVAAGAARDYLFGEGTDEWLVLIVLGICAAFSRDSDESGISAGPLIVAGSGAIAVFWHRSVLEVTLLVLSLIGLATSIAFAGWLLVCRAESDREQHVFVVGSLLLLAGIAAYLSLSALAAGFFAGLLWSAIDITSRIRMTLVVEYLERPLAALLLLVAGAGLTVSTEMLILTVVFVLCRLAISAVTGRSIQASVVGVALAIDASRAWGLSDPALILLHVVIIGTVMTETIAIVTSSREVIA